MPAADRHWRLRASLERVSPLYLEALLALEDRRFRLHPGVDPLAALRAAWQNLRAGRVVSGASTLSMQTARLLEPMPRGLLGKLRQSLRALQLEWRLSKEEILELYLAFAPFGGNLSGLRAASLAYLGKEPERLSHAEAALLAVLPKAPSRLRPDRHPEAARAARDRLLARLAAEGIWPGGGGRARPRRARSRPAPAVPARGRAPRGGGSPRRAGRCQAPSTGSSSGGARPCSPPASRRAPRAWPARSWCSTTARERSWPTPPPCTPEASMADGWTTRGACARRAPRSSPSSTPWRSRRG
ncbi:MAG: transglycosylase domain-containing protein [Xanthomonadales bacterium]|nr:transglycosylase domain-containing protein [Xanthomonadales bacterium]